MLFSQPGVELRYQLRYHIALGEFTWGECKQGEGRTGLIYEEIDKRHSGPFVAVDTICYSDTRSWEDLHTNEQLEQLVVKGG